MKSVSPHSRREGTSLAELLVVMAVLGTLASLLMPAIQSAREAARASSCRDNLRQVGLALTNFESAHKHFPRGAEGRYDRKLSPAIMYGVSWWADILPQLDEASIADQLDRSGVSTGWVYLNPRNGELADDFASPIWFCPSSLVNRFVKVGDYQLAAPSYSGISGATGHDGFPEARVSRCCRSEGQISAGGMLVPNTVIRTGQVLDGLSHTLIVGEQSDFAYTEAGQPIPIGAAFLKGWIAGTVTLGVPPNYVDWLAPSYNLATVRYRLNERRYDLPGVYDNMGANNPLLSPHPGVVNLLYCDGSVHAMYDTLEVNLLKSLATRNDSDLYRRSHHE